MRSDFFKIFTALIVICIAIAHNSFGQVKVRGYYRSNGTYVKPHYRSSPDGNPYNNYSYPGNVNPYTGEIASGREETYLANYYKTYSNTSPTSFTNYSNLLLRTNYRGMKFKKNYDLRYHGEATGHAEYYGDRIFKIYDLENIHIGYVKFNRTSRKYTVYDRYNFITSTNRGSNRGTVEDISIVLIGAGLIFLLLTTD